ncbi:MAG: hydrogenase maturation protease [Proteobacteria bacterium]|nr:hydrogenase maturation protease [Pseudomonadota bacterium]
MNKLLLFGYGNPGRGDDGLGPMLVEHIGQLQLAGVTCLVDMQLLIEHATDLCGFDQIIFVDADMSCQEPFEFSAAYAEKDDSYTSHALTPAALLHVYRHIRQGAVPAAFLLRIRGYRFELGDVLSAQADNNLAAAIRKIRQWHAQHL